LVLTSVERFATSDPDACADHLRALGIRARHNGSRGASRAQKARLSLDDSRAGAVARISLIIRLSRQELPDFGALAPQMSKLKTSQFGWFSRGGAARRKVATCHPGRGNIGDCPMRLACAATAMVWAMTSIAAAGPLEDGIAAFNRFDYTSAVRLLRPLAEQGNDRAQDRLGYMYSLGVGGLPRDYAQATEWLQRAANQSNSDAMNNLGAMYDSGRGVPADGAMALRWYNAAAALGNSSAQANLGLLYYAGRYVGRDDALAAYWYRRAADQGNAAAQYVLGSMYRRGEGVTQSDFEATLWFGRAARLGNAEAQFALAEAYDQGRGVVQRDPSAAAEWLRKAANQGHAFAQWNLGRFYESGYGVTRNLEEALRWYDEARDNALPEATRTEVIASRDRVANELRVAREAPFVLLVTWFYFGQQPTNYQVEFVGRDHCDEARQAVLAEAERLRPQYGLRQTQMPGGGFSIWNAGPPPQATAICVARQ
jgi:TPR repeat protein